MNCSTKHTTRILPGFILILVFLLLGSPVGAQDVTGTIIGNVVAVDGSALPGVTIEITSEVTGFQRLVVTDGRGSFEVPNVPAGRYNVVASLTGFAETSRSVNVRAGGSANSNFTLSAGAAAEITVTGTLIPRPTLDALSPVAVVGVEEIAFSGVTRIEDLMGTLPQAFVGQNSTWANGATGTATVDLRNLGSNRTLVLMNGRRLPPGNAFTPSSADLNFVPASLIERVDVLTGGASSVYGADAVSGVVNFVLDTNFEGVRGGVQYSFFNHDNRNVIAQEINRARGFAVPDGTANDGGTVNANVAWGGKFADGRGRATMFFTYRDNEAVTKSQRDYINCSVGEGSSGPVCGGSSTSPQGRFIAFGKDGSFVGDFLLHWAEDGGDGHSFRPRVSSDVFNFGPFNHIQRPDERWNAGAFLNYEINEHAEGYADVLFMDDYTNAQIAPSGNFAVVNRVNCDNPLLSAQQHDLLCVQGGYEPTDYADVFILRRNVEGGPRNEDISHTTYRIIGGVRGDINDTWSYDLSGLTSEAASQFSYDNDLNVGRMAHVLDVITDPVTGQAVCRDPAARAAGCVPWNIFKQGAVDPAAIAYMETVAVQYHRAQTQLVTATVTGDLEDYGLILPSASEGLAVVFGLGWRDESLFSRPDEVYQFGLAAGFGGGQSPINGSYDVNEAFVEALVPLAQDLPGIRDLSLELGFRYSDYSTTGGADTYKAMLQYAPNSTLKFRGGYNRATRAPNVFELFEAQNFGLGGSNDPCANDPATGVPSFSLEQCIRTGVTPEQYGNVLANPAFQYNTFSGGNPNLAPEVGDTYTAGVVLTPPGLPGFALAVDWYDIEIISTIGNLAADDIIVTCARTGDPLLCDLIHRDRLGTLWLTTEGFTETTTQNIGAIGASGVDVSVSHPVSIGAAGFLQADLTGTYLLESTFANPLVNYDCAGFFGAQCGQANPDWRHRFRLTWETPRNAALSLVWRRVGTVDIDDASSNPDIGDPTAMNVHTINDSARIDAYDWFDLSGTYNITDNVQFSIGVSNLTDKAPPLLPGFADEFAVNLYATYDPLGRYIHSALRFNF
ncbi:MAG TPA: TonB-dependent receptor [Thermoanaerobaculia bacterium]|nr:TonB-dependent receptor [Thermoanaerobaculia bacterium]